MDLKNLALVSGFSIAIIVIGMLIPKGEMETSQIMPWQIETTPSGTTRVFGLALGESTLVDAEQRFKAEAEVSLFAKPDGEYATEVFFEKVELGGLSAKVVIVTGLSQEALAEIYDRGIRISTLGSGTNKVTLGLSDLELIRHATIDSLTYLPHIKLDEEVVKKRFGEPAEIIAEIDHGTTHWLYPDSGLDLILTPKGKAVMQYISPKKFDMLVEPLRELQSKQAESTDINTPTTD